jgi:hypothetical protein
VRRGVRRVVAGAAAALAAVLAGEVAATVGAFPGVAIEARQNVGLEEAFALDADAVVSATLGTDWVHFSDDTFLSCFVMPKQGTGWGRR